MVRDALIMGMVATIKKSEENTYILKQSTRRAQVTICNEKEAVRTKKRRDNNQTQKTYLVQ